MNGSLQSENGFSTRVRFPTAGERATDFYAPLFVWLEQISGRGWSFCPIDPPRPPRPKTKGFVSLLSSGFVLAVSLFPWRFYVEP
jgi:hypothetical protein